MKKVMVLRHVPFEDIGSLARLIPAGGLAIEMVDCFDPAWNERQRQGFDPAQWAGLVVMGGPMNVDETEKYPFLATEILWLQAAIAAELPTLGVCLGSQLLAKALGAGVWPNRVKEIGWYQLELLPAARDDRLFAGCQPSETVFQWHGDTFDLPPGAVQLARSATCEQQAFRYGETAYALQFHLEITALMVADWLTEPEMCAEIAPLDYIDADRIRAQSGAGLTAMAPVTERVLGGFVALCQSRATRTA
jgi:GMP synthase (glutamine-hydrolysing)